MPSPVHTGKKCSFSFQEPAHSGKSTGLFLLTGHFPRTHKSTTEIHFREASFYVDSIWPKMAWEIWSWALKTDWSLSNWQMPVPWNIQERECNAQNTQGSWSTLSFTRCTTAGLYTVDLGKHISLDWFSFFFHSNIVKVLSLLGNLWFQRSDLLLFINCLSLLVAQSQIRLRRQQWRQLLNGENENKN